MKKKLNYEDVAAILYVYYMENYCEDTFSFDDGKSYDRIKKHYTKLKTKIGEDEIEKIKNNITVNYSEGTDYESMEFSHEDFPNLFLQVTAMFDFDDNPVGGYTGDCMWADVGLFFMDYDEVDFEDLA